MPREVFPGYVRTKHVLKLVEASDVTAATAVTLIAGEVLGYTAEVEEFGVIVGAAWAGAGGTLTYQLQDAAGNVIAQLTCALASMTAGAQVKVSAVTASGDGIRANFQQLRDATALALKRIATGTVFTSGSGFFYVKLRQRGQQK